MLSNVKPSAPNVKVNFDNVKLNDSISFIIMLNELIIILSEVYVIANDHLAEVNLLIYNISEPGIDLCQSECSNR